MLSLFATMASPANRGEWVKQSASTLRELKQPVCQALTAFQSRRKPLGRSALHGWGKIAKPASPRAAPSRGLRRYEGGSCAIIETGFPVGFERLLCLPASLSASSAFALRLPSKLARTYERS